MRGLLGASRSIRQRIAEGNAHFQIDEEKIGIKYCDECNREYYTIKNFVRCLKCIGKSVERIDYKIIYKEQKYKRLLVQTHKRLSIQNLNDER